MSLVPKILSPELIEQLLVSKSILDRVRTDIPTSPDRYSVAMNVLLAHDAAELALAAIANHLGARPANKNKTFLMDYFDPIRKNRHPERDVLGKGFFSQLNDARVGFKHHGNFPDTAQFAQVGAQVYKYVSKWCDEYLNVTLEVLDYSVLLLDQQLKRSYEEAKTLLEKKKHQALLEQLAMALHIFFIRNPALPLLSVGVPRAEDAIRLAPFGVHANDFLTLQQFLPEVVLNVKGAPQTQWDQNNYGHPGNWDEVTAQFCLKTFLDVVIKLQSASWIPSPVHFSLLYEHKIEMIEDDVSVFNLPEDKPYTFDSKGNVINRTAIATFPRGTILLGTARLEKEGGLLGLFQEKNPTKQEVLVMTTAPREIFGYVATALVKITCVPREHDYVKKNFPTLTEIDWQESR